MNKIIKTVAGIAMALTMMCSAGTQVGKSAMFSDTAIVAEALTGNFYRGTSWTNWIHVHPRNSRSNSSVAVAAYRQNGTKKDGLFEVQIWSGNGAYCDYKYVTGSQTIYLNYGYNSYNLRIRRRNDSGDNHSKTQYWAVNPKSNVKEVKNEWGCGYFCR